jgi:hypothetical protein
MKRKIAPQSVHSFVEMSGDFLEFLPKIRGLESRVRMRTLKAVAAAMLTLSPISVQAAATCEQFKAAIVEGAAQYQASVPKFRLDGVNSADADRQFWTIITFGDVRAAMSCWLVRSRLSWRTPTIAR